MFQQLLLERRFIFVCSLFLRISSASILQDLDCSFEYDWCGWQMDPNTDKDWRISWDSDTWGLFQTAADGDDYIFANLTGEPLGTEAILESPIIEVAASVCVRVFINPLGASSTKFIISRSGKPREKLEVFSMDSFDLSAWSCVRTKVDVKVDSKIFFTLIHNGANPDVIGLDGIEFFDVGQCDTVDCNNMVQTSTIVTSTLKTGEQTSSNTGHAVATNENLPVYVGVPASVVALAFIGGLLIVCFRFHREQFKHNTTIETPRQTSFNPGDNTSANYTYIHDDINHGYTEPAEVADEHEYISVIEVEALKQRPNDTTEFFQIDNYLHPIQTKSNYHMPSYLELM